MFNWVKNKIKNGINWLKEKAKQVLIGLGIVGVALAAGTQTTILDTSPINYPLTVNLPIEKLEYLYRAEELLRLQHNEMGRQFRKGEIAQEEWQTYLKEYFDPKSKWLGWGISTTGEQIEYLEIDAISSTTGKAIRIKVPPEGYNVEFMKQSDSYKIDLNNILKK